MSPTGPAGGDLNGTYPNPGVNGLAAVIAESAGNAATLASLVPSVNTLQKLQSGNGALDGTGALTITTTLPTNSLVATWSGTPGIGTLSVTTFGGGTWQVVSSAGITDAGLLVNWLAF